jgi:hypothetical protein
MIAEFHSHQNSCRRHDPSSFRIMSRVKHACQVAAFTTIHDKMKGIGHPMVTRVLFREIESAKSGGTKYGGRDWAFRE